jgi:hypothetical protein
MCANRASQSPLNSTVAARLLAHARLCEHAAQECWNEKTAEKLRRMARACIRAAAQVAAQGDAEPRQPH